LLRPGTVDEIFLHKVYDLDLVSPRFIRDAGAHIGLASVFFASRFPGAQVVSLEPAESDFHLLAHNALKFPKRVSEDGRPVVSQIND
jgi:tRNA1(Val) A37 N6-methylase TrmN6